jgi:hypothetical protein
VIPLTYDKAANLLDECVNEMGKETTTKIALYFRGDQPECLIGHVLAKLGVTHSAVIENNASVLSVMNRQLSILDVDQKTMNLLGTAQFWNDGGRPWGEAVKLAKTDPYPFS